MSDDIPQTPFALISGTAGWGLKFPDDLKEPGVRVLERGLSFETPWGPTHKWQVIEFDGSITADGRARTALNVFAHGWPVDRIDHSAQRRVFWVLDRAGVKKVLADSTCGSLNRAVQPRDFVIASDMLYLSQTEYSVLPGRQSANHVGGDIVAAAIKRQSSPAFAKRRPAVITVLQIE